MWNVERTARFQRDYKKLSHEMQRKCDVRINELAHSADPRSIGTRMVNSQAYKIRFDSYRLVYMIHDRIQVLSMERVGPGHSAYHR